MPPPMEPWGNLETMNLNEVLHVNIIGSPYFNTLQEIDTFEALVDEMDQKEPFLKGTTASTAFCLLYRLHQLRPTARHIQTLVTHPDSSYLRGMGFLYLRYANHPKHLWDWYFDYMDDEDTVLVATHPKRVVWSIGKLCRELLTIPKWGGSMMPRIPVPIERNIRIRWREYEEEQDDIETEFSTSPPPLSSTAKVEGGKGEKEEEEGEKSGGRSGSRTRFITPGTSTPTDTLSTKVVLDDFGRIIRNPKPDTGSRPHHRSRSRSPMRQEGLSSIRRDHLYFRQRERETAEEDRQRRRMKDTRDSRGGYGREREGIK
ncbi:MAG: PRP38 family-domain-containing protein [Piptocephalis tieghemiana]|nr:MAG: PRP38 family-domain-containing protein [Piptocephalis tieghemiana]